VALEQADHHAGALEVASLPLLEHGGELRLGSGARDQGMDDVAAVFEDRTRDAGLRRRHLACVGRLGGRTSDGGDPGLGVDQVVEPCHQRLLGADAVVHRLRRDAGGAGDVAHAGAGVATLGEQAAGGLEDLVPREPGAALSEAERLLRHRYLTSVPMTL
jgi:hypothetical protein